jgi:DNA-binding LacI/PurR family transcriptional regulator
MDSVFVANDQMALAVLQVAHRLGMQIPQDLGVVGFDNLTESAYFWPPLTTLNQNQYELGRQAVLVLVKQIEASRKAEKAAEQQSILLPPELVVRESSVA